MTKIQLALDVLDIDKALKITKEVEDIIDYIEVGTPLIKSNGGKAIVKIRDHFPNKTVIADMKTIDTGERDCIIAFNNGADGIIVQAVAPIETIKKVSDIAKDKNKIMMIDALGIKDIEKLNSIANKFQPNHTILHIGIDEQPTHDLSMLFDMANIAEKHEHLPSIALAGGIGSNLLKRISKIPKNVNIIIVGAAITSSKNPRNEASLIKELLNNL